MATQTLQARRFASGAELRAAILACRYIKKDGPDNTPWCVYSESGERIACHETHEDAVAQLAAIEANKGDKARREEDEQKPKRQPATKLPTPTIAKSGDKWTVTTSEGSIEVDSRAEAFELVESTEWFAQTTTAKNVHQFEGLADGRWVDAASVEDLPSAIDGSQIRDEAITQMADNLARERTPLLVDGGGISEAHESVWNNAAKAAGWVFAGVRVEGDDGKAHLWLWVRLQPGVDEQLDRRELSFGSIAFLEATTDRYTGDTIGAQLLSYALTNTPFVDGLEPHAPRAQRSQRSTGRSIAITRSRRAMSDTPATRPHTDEPGNEPSPEDNDPAEAFESEEEVRMFATDELRWWREVTGQPELSPAGAADLRTSITDAVKGALAADTPQDGLPSEGDRNQVNSNKTERNMSQSTNENEDTQTANDPTPQEPPQRSGEGNGNESATRAEVQLEAVKSRVDALESENQKLRERIERDDAEKAVDKMSAERKLQLGPEQRDKFVRAVLSQGADEVVGWLDAINVPPQGTSTDPSKGEQPAAQPSNQKEAVDRAKDDLKRDNPEITKRELRTQGYERAKRDYPELFRL